MQQRMVNTFKSNSCTPTSNKASWCQPKYLLVRHLSMYDIAWIHVGAGPTRICHFCLRTLHLAKWNRNHQRCYFKSNSYYHKTSDSYYFLNNIFLLIIDCFYAYTLCLLNVFDNREVDDNKFFPEKPRISNARLFFTLFTI